MYDIRDLDELDPNILEPLIAERLAWMATSLNKHVAAKQLGWTLSEFLRVMRDKGITAGRLGRYSAAAVNELAADEELSDQVRGNRLIGPAEAALHLEIRPTDFNYCVAAGWIKPAASTSSKVSRKRWVDVPLFRVADVEAVLDIADVDWEAVRSVRPGERSELAKFARLPIHRGTLVRGFAADLAKKHGIEIDTDYDYDRDSWTLCWTPNATGKPARDTVRAAINTDPDLQPHSYSIVLRLVTPQPTEEGTPS